MGGVVSAVKKAVVNAAKAVWNGIKYIAKKTYNAVKYVAKKAVQFVKTVVGKVVVMVAVVTALVAGSIIGHVLESFSLGLFAGVTIFLGIFLLSSLIFGSRHQQDENKDENKDGNTNNENSNGSYFKSSARCPGEKPDFDTKPKNKKLDHLKELLENVESFIEDCENNPEIMSEIKKNYSYTFNKDGEIIDKKKKEGGDEKEKGDDDIDSDSVNDDNFHENKDGNTLASHVYYYANDYGFYLNFKNEAETQEIVETNMNNILKSLKSYFTSYNIEFDKSKEKNEDYTTKKIIIHKKNF